MHDGFPARYPPDVHRHESSLLRRCLRPVFFLDSNAKVTLDSLLVKISRNGNEKEVLCVGFEPFSLVRNLMLFDT